jgi:murein DD-endopeptidase MepM/ murein hydrolase activator NlpD
MFFHKKNKALKSKSNKIDTYNVTSSKTDGSTYVKQILSPMQVIKKISKAAACFVILVLMVTSTFYYFQLRLGSEIIVNGASIGFVGDKNDFYSTLNDVKNLEALASETGTNSTSFNVDFVPRVIKATQITSDFELRQKLLAGCEKMVDAYAIYVNSRLICATVNETDAFFALDKVKTEYSIGKNIVSAEFIDTIAVRPELVPLTQILSTDEVVGALSGDSQHSEIYTSAIDDTLYNIAERFGMTLEQITQLNPALNSNVPIGQKVNIVKTEAVVHVETKMLEEYTQTIAFSTESTDDNTLAKGKEEIIKKGINGENKVTASVTRINGAEQDRVIVSEEVAKPVQNQVSRIGTNVALAKAETSDQVPAGSKTMIRPTSGVVYSGYGSRSGGEFHTGIDFSPPYGTNIYAAIGGRVIMSDYNGNYGKCVRIDSGNGLIEIYAHCSQLLVKEGQVVKQGELIAKTGSTGRSTGPHLHFEVRKNGQFVDPNLYL